MLIGAHRGAYKDEPALDENSLSAFKRAIDFKCDYIEFDVHMTRDKKFIIHHDASLMYNSSKVMLKEMSWVDALEHFRLPLTNEPLPLLDDVLALCKGKIKMNVEIKDPSIGKDVTEFILSAGVDPKDFLISSFHTSVLQDITDHFRGIQTGFLFLGNFWSSKPAKQALNLSCKAIHPYYRFLNKRLVKFALSNNLEINTWTVDGKAIPKLMKKDFLTSIITNDVLLALSTRTEVSS